MMTRDERFAEILAKAVDHPEAEARRDVRVAVILDDVEKGGYVRYVPSPPDHRVAHAAYQLHDKRAVGTGTEVMVLDFEMDGDEPVLIGVQSGNMSAEGEWLLDSDGAEMDVLGFDETKHLARTMGVRMADEGGA